MPEKDEIVLWIIATFSFIILYNSLLMYFPKTDLLISFTEREVCILEWWIIKFESVCPGSRVNSSMQIAVLYTTHQHSWKPYSAKTYHVYQSGTDVNVFIVK